MFAREWLKENRVREEVRLNECRLVVAMNEEKGVCAPPLPFKSNLFLRASVQLDD